MIVLYEVCYSLVPLCINYKTKEQKYQKEINQILDLPAIMQNLTTPEYIHSHMKGTKDL